MPPAANDAGSANSIKTCLALKLVRKGLCSPIQGGRPERLDIANNTGGGDKE